LNFLYHRFYFVGDEDLLEIIGNSKNVPKLQKHFKKMFAGVASVILNKDNTQVLGICSREGEQVSAWLIGIIQNGCSTGKGGGGGGARQTVFGLYSECNTDLLYKAYDAFSRVRSFFLIEHFIAL